MKLSRAIDKKLLVNNYLSIDGDDAAASRYTEARLKKVVSAAMLDLLNKKGIVKMMDTYDGKMQEPTVLPVRFPVALTNPISGIAIGYATNIPSYNLRELIEACIYLLGNKDEITDEEFMGIVKGPDFPTGGVISGIDDITKATLTGEGGFLNRGDYIVEEDKKINRIIFTSIPYGISKVKVMQDLKLMHLNNEVPGIKYCEDESTDDVRIVIELDKSTDIKVLLGYIFNKTSMSLNFSSNMTFIHDGKPRVMGAIEVLKVFNSFRIGTKRFELEYDKQKLEDRLHIVEGYIKLAGIVDEVIKEIKLSKGKEDAKQRLVKKFDFSEAQSEAIVSMQLHRLSRTDKKAYLDEKKEIKSKLSEINKILKSDKLLRDEIIKELEQISEEFGSPRKTKVVKRVEKWDVNELDLVEEEEVYVSVSKNGYFKRSSKRSYGSTEKVEYNNGDEAVLESVATTKDVLLALTSKGRYYRLPVFTIEEQPWKNSGKYLGAVGTLDKDETIVGAYILPEEDSESNDKFIFTIKDDGLVNKASLKKYVVSRHNNSYDNIKLDDGVSVVGAYLVGKEGFIGLESSDGKAINFDINEVAPKGINVNGMRGINLKEGCKVVGTVFNEDRNEIKYSDGKRGGVGQKQRKK